MYMYVHVCTVHVSTCTYVYQKNSVNYVYTIEYIIIYTTLINAYITVRLLHPEKEEGGMAMKPKEWHCKEELHTCTYVVFEILNFNQ